MRPFKLSGVDIVHRFEIIPVFQEYSDRCTKVPGSFLKVYGSCRLAHWEGEIFALKMAYYYVVTIQTLPQNIIELKANRSHPHTPPDLETQTNILDW